MVGKQLSDLDVGTAPAGDAAGRGQGQLSRCQVKRTQAGDAAGTAIGATETEYQRAIAGNQPIVTPITTGAGEGLARQQLTIGGLLEVTDIDRQTPSLDDGTVGPAIGIEGQATLGDDATASVADVRQGYIEDTIADV